VLLLSEAENDSLLKVLLTLESQRKKQGRDDPASVEPQASI
jgi:hypothetical protein